MAKINLPNDDDFNDFSDPDELMDKASKALFEDEGDLRKEINKLKRWEKKLRHEHELEISALRLQIQHLLAKNFDLTEANNIFARGLEQLKQDNRIITECHMHHLIDNESLKKAIDELTKPPAFGQDLKRRIVSIVPTKSNSHGQATAVMIVTERTEKTKKAKELREE